MRANRKRDTKPELALRRAVFRLGFRYRCQARTVAGAVTVRPDLTFQRLKVAVFMDGCFWHGCPVHGTAPRTNSEYWAPKIQRNRARDEVVSAALRDAGWLVLRVWEHEDPDLAAALIGEAVLNRATLMS